MMALTISLLLLRRARTAFRLETLACDITRSISLVSTPVSSICYNIFLHILKAEATIVIFNIILYLTY